MAYYRQRESKPFSRELDFMMKIKPWRKYETFNLLPDEEKKSQHLLHICRYLAAYAPSVFGMNISDESQKLERWTKKHGKFPFLTRNLLSGRKAWTDYERKLRKWFLEKKGKQISDNACQSQCETNSHFATVFKKTDLLRSFYTMWLMSTLTSKSSKNEEELARLISLLATSSRLEKVLLKIPNGGIQAEKIIDTANLSRKCRLTLSRWARAMNKSDRCDSGDEEDPIEVWNRAITETNKNATGSNNEVKLPEKPFGNLSNEFIEDLGSRTETKMESNKVDELLNSPVAKTLVQNNDLSNIVASTSNKTIVVEDQSKSTWNDKENVSLKRTPQLRQRNRLSLPEGSILLRSTKKMSHVRCPNQIRKEELDQNLKNASTGKKRRLCSSPELSESTSSISLKGARDVSSKKKFSKGKVRQETPRRSMPLIPYEGVEKEQN